MIKHLICFYCCKEVLASQITKWVDKGKTALCPHCEIDSVVTNFDAFKMLQHYKFKILYKDKPPDEHLGISLKYPQHEEHTAEGYLPFCVRCKLPLDDVHKKEHPCFEGEAIW